MKWKRVTVFISSTFNDMHAERDYLVKDVFPELREWCEERKIHLVDIDLRWGVTEADARSKHTVLACLNNIDGSRPFFICFLGQRRGWIPEKGDISAETIDEYPDVSSVIGRKSVTEMEIEHALLSPMRHIVNGKEKLEIQVDHALFYFRNPDYLDDITKEQRNIFTNENECDIEKADKELNSFKEKIKNEWEYTVDYTCRWNKSIISPELPENVNQGRLTAFHSDRKPLKNIILKQLKNEIIKEFPNRGMVEYASDLEKDLDQQALFIEINSEGFIAREGDFNALNDYITNDKDGLYVLSDVAGSGKSMLLANFIMREGKNHAARFFYRFCGISDLSSQQYSLWRTIFDEAHITCPDTLKDLKDNITDLLQALADEKTVLIIDAVNQLPDGQDMLEWLPKQLPENIKIIVSIKEDNDDEELTSIIERLQENENISYQTVKPFKEKEEKKKLIKDYLKKYLKALDEKQIDTICDFKGSENPLYLKILLSELRVFGSFFRLSEEIHQFGNTPKEAFNTVLNRLEKDVNSSNIDSEVFVPLLFGLLANARNGLSEKELVECIQQDFGVDEEKLIQAVRLFIRQVRPFMANREGRTDYFYEAFKSAAKERYIHNAIHYNKILSEYFRKQADPEHDFSFKSYNIRDFNELPYHLKESGNTGCLEKILSTFRWINNKSERSDVFNTIEDYNYIDFDKTDNYHVKLIKDTLKLSSHILKDNVKNLPAQLWGRLKVIDNQKIRELLIEIDKHADYPWLKPQHDMQTPEESLDVTLLHNMVSSVCFSPDGKHIVTGGGNAVKVWDWKKIKEVRRLEGLYNNDFIETGLSFSPDGKYIAVGSNDKTIIVWDWKNKKEIQKLKGHTGCLSCVCFSPDGKYIASSGSWDDKTVRVWDWKNGKEVQRLNIDEVWVECVCFSPDGKYIASGDYETVRVWDWEKNEEVQRLKGIDNEVKSVCFSPDGKYLASGFWGRTISIWDWKSAKEVQRLRAKSVVSICFSPDGKYIIAGSGGRLEAMSIIVWDWEKQGEIQRLFGHKDTLKSVCISPDGNFIASGSNDHTVRIWDFKKNLKTNKRYKGHTDSIESICISPDGKYIATGSYDSYIKVWELDKMKEAVILEYDGRLFKKELLVQCVCFSPDGKLLASGDLDSTIGVWDCENQSIIQRFEGHKNAVLCVIFSPDGKYIVSGSMDNTVRIWDCENQKEILCINCKNFIYSICFSPDGKYLAVGDKQIRIWDWDNQKEVLRLESNSDQGRSLCFSSDGKYLATGGYSGTIGVWDWKNARELQGLEGHTDCVGSVCFSNDGNYIVSGSEDKTVRIWDWEKHRQCIVLDTEEKISSCFFSNDNHTIVAGGNSGHILLYDVKNLPVVIPKDPIIRMNEEIRNLDGHVRAVNSVCFSPNGEYIASGGWDNTIRIWDWEKSNEIVRLEGHDRDVLSVSFSPDGKYIASGSWETAVRLWDWENQKETQRLESHNWYVSNVCFSPDGKYLASASSMEDIIKIWDRENAGKVTQIQTGHTQGVTSVFFSPDGKYLVSGSYDKTIKIWDWEKEKELQTLVHPDSVMSVCFSPDMKYIASGSFDRIVRVWDWEKRTELQRLEGHTWFVLSVRFSSDGEFIVSGSKDRTIRVWDWKHNCEIQRLEGHTWDVTSVCFSPDDKYIASGSRDSTIRIWDWGNP